MKNYTTFFFLAMGLIAQVNAAEYYVAPGGDDARDGSSWAQAWKTISNGVFKAAAGSTLILSNGEYALTTQVRLEKEITLTSATDAAADVVVNGGGEVRCFYLNHSKAIVDGITISNGYAHTTTPNAAYGGGVYVIDGVLRHCVIRNNTAATNDETISTYSGYGGGAYLSGGMLLDSQVTYNFAGSKLGVGGNGGGIYVSSNAVVSNCMIMGNTSRYYGGGISCVNTGNVVNCCLVVSNENPGNGGGGMYLPSGTLLNSTCIWNTAVSMGGGIYAVGGMISNCLIASNQSADTIFGGGGIYNHYAAGATSYVYNSIIRGNSATKKNGGGIYCRANKAYMRDCIIEQNSASSEGGGIYNYADMGGLTISNSTIRANTSSGGGGISINCGLGFNMDQCLIVSNISRGNAGGLSANQTNFYISNCRFYGNIATNDGGGVYLNPSSESILTQSLLCNSLFYNNSASNGGGISISSWGSIVNCTIVSNYASTKGGGLYYANSSGLTRTALVENCVIYSNSCSTYPNWSCYGGKTYFNNSCTFPVPSGNAIGVNTITNDPRLSNIEGMDCRLLADSPCINTGTNQEWMAGAVDLDGHQRLDHFSRQVDMGAYEFLLRGMLFTGR